MKPNPNLSRLFIILFVLFSSCKKDDKADDFSSPQNLFVEYVSAYTKGYIPSQSQIKVKLAKSIDTAEPGKEIDIALFNFDPGLDGTTFWEDNRTIVFKPSKKLESGKKYKAIFHLGKLMETQPDLEEFRFTFGCIPQNYEVKLEGMSLYDAQDLTRVKIMGSLQTADIVSGEEIRNIIQARQDDKELEISYDRGTLNNQYKFIIENVSRTEKKGNVKISWDGDAIEVEKKGETDYTVPSLTDYTITAVNIVRTDDNYVSVLFSDPIDDKQNLRGIVKFSEGTNPRVVVDLNELKIYPTSNLTGQVRLTINKSIKNTAGYTLDDHFNTSLQFSQLKPAVRMATNKGVIMPNSKGLIVPFEAASLNAVDLTIVRVFENNVLQYLQVNDPGRDYQLKRVGRPVFRKVIPLTTTGVVDLNDWNRFTIDISELIKVEPGAFYQVRLNFRPSYAMYFCPGTGEDSELDTFGEDWGFEESTAWDYWDDYYYYDWENRDNPCHQAYYTRDRLVSKIILASDLGIIAKKADKGRLNIFSTNLLTTEPMSGVDIEVYDYQQQVIGTGSTDNNGTLAMDVEGIPFVVVAQKDNQFGYLKVDDGSSLSLSNFNVTGTRVREGIKGFLYGERGVWRPGDTLHLSFILEDIQDRLPAGHPVILEFVNPLGQLHSRNVQTTSLNDMYVYHITTPGDAPTGNWQARVKVGGAEFSKQIKIETVKPNRLKIDLNFGKERLLPDEGAHSADLNVRWLHGAVARNLKTTYEVLLVPAKTTFDGYANYTFDDPSKEFNVEPKVIYEGNLNTEGYDRMSFRLTTENDPPGMLNAVFRGKVFEEGGDFSIDKTAIPYIPYNSFVGLQVPEGDNWGMLGSDKAHNIRIITVDPRGNPVSRREIEIELYKIRWRWWWDNSWENSSNYTSRYSSELVKTSSINTSGGEGIYKLNVERSWGRYFLKVKDPVSGHSAGEVLYMRWTGSQRGELGGATMLDFAVENEKVRVGEDIRINIPSSAGGRALVSLETGSDILQTFWVETEPDNTAVQFEATAAMAPNVYAHITLLQPHAQTINDLPIRMYGVHAVEVLDPETELNPVIQMPDELQPEKKFTVQVSEQNQKPMTYTVAIVEDGLLDLTKYKTPEPWKTFYAREALGIKTWDVFDDVMGAYGGEIERLLALGGDDEIQGPDAEEANRFEPVVMFKGPFFIGAGKKAEHSFKMPRYVGSVRTMVIAGYEGSYGNAEKTLPVKQPLMVLATLPRVAGPAEEIVLPVNVFTMNDNIREVKIKVEPAGKLQLSGAGSRTVHFTQSGDQVSYFKLKAAETLGVGKVKITATSGNLSATYAVELQIRPGNPLMSQVDESIVNGGGSWENDYQPLGLAGTNEGVVEVSSLPPINLEQRLKFLVRYPHGCIEQTTSAVFAQLYLDDLMELDDERAEDIQNNINAAIERLRAFQLTSGGFTYWPGNSQPSYWGTNYAGHFLLEAKKQGYHVPEDMISKWVLFQKDLANEWTEAMYRDYLIQTYRLYTLALAGNPALGAMNRMKEMTNITTRANWSLASAYAAAGYDQAANEIITGLTTTVDDYRELGGSYGSTQRDQAIMLETMVHLGMETDAFEMVRKISEYMSNGNRWMSTQTTAYCLVAIAEFAKKFPPGGDINVRVNVAGNDFRLDGIQYMHQVTLIEPDKQAGIRVENNGQNPLFVRIIRTGVPLEGTESSHEQNVRLDVKYKDMQRRSLSVNDISQGTDFMAEVTVTNPGLRGNYEEMAITQIFPSGWEILNTRLDDTGQFYQQDKPEYQDIRDDRVMTYFDLNSNKSATFRILLNASYQGKYYLPAVSVEAMYDNSISANTEGQWVMVSRDE